MVEQTLLEEAKKEVLTWCHAAIDKGLKIVEESEAMRLAIQDLQLWT